MAVVNVRLDKETKKRMEAIRVNWSEVVREAIRRKIEEENGKNLAKAVLINERLRRESKGEMKAEDIIRKFRDERRKKSSA